MHKQLHFVIFDRDRTKPALQSLRCIGWNARAATGNDLEGDTSKHNELTKNLLGASKEMMRETKRRCQAGLLSFSLVLYFDGIVMATPLCWQQAGGFGSAHMADVVSLVASKPSYFASTPLAEQLNELVQVRHARSHKA